MEYNNAGPGPTHAKLYEQGTTPLGGIVMVRISTEIPHVEIFKLYDMVNAEVFQNIASTNQVGCYGFAAESAVCL